MGVQRTREQKQKAQIRREEAGYTWTHEPMKTVSSSEKTSTRPSRSPVSELGFQIDMKRTLMAFLACLLVLTTVYVLRG